MTKLRDDFSLSPLALELGEAVRACQASVTDFDRETARALGINETDLRCLEILLHDLPYAAPGILARRLGLTSGGERVISRLCSRRSSIAVTDQTSTLRHVPPLASSASVRLAASVVGWTIILRRSL